MTIVYNFRYPYPAPDNPVVIKVYGVKGSNRIFRDGAYVNWTSIDASNNEVVTSVDANANGLQFTLLMDMLDTCYAIIAQSGDVLFAGVNSPYYGYTNINDM